MEIFAKTDVGRVRSANQDSFRIARIGDFTLGVVCDGMGGANGGSVASATACDVFVGTCKEAGGALVVEGAPFAVLGQALEAANTAVYEKAVSDASLEGMGTTLLAVLTDEKRVYALSVGDSRIYRLTDDAIVQLSHDHSFVQALVDNGSITREQSKNHPNKNIITRAVGTQHTVDGDLFALDFTGGAFLLCTDGLTGYVEDETLLALYRKEQGAENVVNAYIEAANEAGGGDNITALMITKDARKG